MTAFKPGGSLAVAIFFPESLMMARKTSANVVCVSQACIQQRLVNTSKTLASNVYVLQRLLKACRVLLVLFAFSKGL